MTLWLAALLTGMAGAILGSFLATIVVRWPEARSVLSGRSMCDGCARPLGAHELVPLVSYALAGGRCRSCGAPIDRTHLIIELAAFAAGLFAILWTGSLSGLALAIFVWLALPLALLDYRHRWLPDALTFWLGAAGLLVGGTIAGIAIEHRLIGAVAGGGALYLIGAAFRWLRGRDGLGFGDVKLLAAIALWTGWAMLPVLLLGASMLGLVVAMMRGDGRDSAYPFGTLLLIAGSVMLAAQARGFTL